MIHNEFNALRKKYASKLESPHMLGYYLFLSYFKSWLGFSYLSYFYTYKNKISKKKKKPLLNMLRAKEDKTAIKVASDV